jgi:Uma2 family endonuclease
MDFLEGAPAFAAEIRSKGDYGPKAEQAILAKINDYFTSGTQVVWDVDLLGPEVIRVYRAKDSANPTVYRHGDTAEAEPAVPGWSFSVDQLFR